MTTNTKEPWKNTWERIWESMNRWDWVNPTVDANFGEIKQIIKEEYQRNEIATNGISLEQVNSVLGIIEIAKVQALQHRDREIGWMIGKIKDEYHASEEVDEALDRLSSRIQQSHE